jgi:hypothetical protein
MVQTCVVHLVRNRLRYASKADWSKITAGLKTIYTSATLARPRPVSPSSPTPGAASTRVRQTRYKPQQSTAHFSSVVDTRTDTRDARLREDLEPGNGVAESHEGSSSAAGRTPPQRRHGHAWRDLLSLPSSAMAASCSSRLKIGSSSSDPRQAFDRDRGSTSSGRLANGRGSPCRPSPRERLRVSQPPRSQPTTRHGGRRSTSCVIDRTACRLRIQPGLSQRERRRYARMAEPGMRSVIREYRSPRNRSMPKSTTWPVGP